MQSNHKVYLTYSRIKFYTQITIKNFTIMKRNVIKKQLQNRLNWNYNYFNVIDSEGIIIETFDSLLEAGLFVNKHPYLFIQKCHNISYIL